MSLQSSLASLAKFSSSLRALPTQLALRIADKSAPALTELAMQTFNAGEDSYGVTWEPGAEGQHITLRQTGALAKYIRYVAIGTKLRVALGVAYAKYQVGKRPIFPTQGGLLPLAYSRKLAEIAQREAKAFLAESK